VRSLRLSFIRKPFNLLVLNEKFFWRTIYVLLHCWITVIFIFLNYISFRGWLKIIPFICHIRCMKETRSHCLTFLNALSWKLTWFISSRNVKHEDMLYWFTILMKLFFKFLYLITLGNNYTVFVLRFWLLILFLFQISWRIFVIIKAMLKSINFLLQCDTRLLLWWLKWFFRTFKCQVLCLLFIIFYQLLLG